MSKKPSKKVSKKRAKKRRGPLDISGKKRLEGLDIIEGIYFERNPNDKIYDAKIIGIVYSEVNPAVETRIFFEEEFSGLKFDLLDKIQEIKEAIEDLAPTCDIYFLDTIPDVHPDTSRIVVPRRYSNEYKRIVQKRKDALKLYRYVKVKLYGKLASLDDKLKSEREYLRLLRVRFVNEKRPRKRGGLATGMKYASLRIFKIEAEIDNIISEITNLGGLQTIKEKLADAELLLRVARSAYSKIDSIGWKMIIRDDGNCLPYKAKNLW